MSVALPSDYATLRWLTWHRLRNRVRAALKKPTTWVFVVLFGSYAAWGAYAILTLGGEPGTPVNPAAVDLVSWSAVTLVMLGMTIIQSAAVGSTILNDPDSFVVHVLGAPISRLSIVRSRLAFTVSAAIAVTLGLAWFGGLWVASMVDIGRTEAVLRVWAVLLPVTLTGLLGGTLASAAGRRWGGLLGNAVVVAALLLAAAWLVLLPPGLSGVQQLEADPVSQAFLALARPYAAWMAGQSAAVGAAAIVGTWALSGGLLAVGARLRYPLPGTFGTAPVAGDRAGLGPERQPAEGWTRRLRELFRFRYRDYGGDSGAVRGLAVTLYLRTAGVFAASFSLAMIGFAAWLFGPAPGGSLFAPALLMFVALLFGGMGVGTDQGNHTTLLFDKVRSLPITGRHALGGLLTTRVVYLGALGAITGVAVAYVSRDGLLGVLAGAVMATALFLVGCARMLAAPQIPPPSSLTVTTRDRGTLLALGMFMAVIVGETFVTLSLPSPDGWNPLWLPFALEVGVNILAIWAIWSLMARRVVAPYSGR